MASLSKVFVFTAQEHLNIASAIKRNLVQYCEEVRVWDELVFRLGENGLHSLTNELRGYDFVIVVVDPTAEVTDRNTKASAPRDNILFEIGLSIGIVGNSRTFMIHEKDAHPKLPTDLAGVTLARYKSNSKDFAALVSSLRVPCDEIIDEIKRKGPRGSELKIDMFANRSELQGKSEFDKALANSIEFDLVTFSGQFLRDYKPDIENALKRGTKIRIIAYDPGPRTAIYYDALVNSLQLGVGENKRTEAEELRNYITELTSKNSLFEEQIFLKFLCDDLLLYNLWISRQTDGQRNAHLTMYFHGRDAPSFRLAGPESPIFKTIEQEFEQLWAKANDWSRRELGG